MSVAGGTDRLSEPAVLAIAKQHLFAPEDEDSYAVTDTQFATDFWRSGDPVDDRIHTVLSPYNHVRLGSGYPDLVGVGRLDDEYLEGATHDRQGGPLIAVEAKGHAHGGVDVERGITQAYDRLADANAVYLAAPADAITSSARSMARSLNVGVLSVTPDEAMTIVEVPRAVGAQAPEAARAIRFQATAQGVVDQSFGLNHPKNYLAYPLAVFHPETTEAVMERHVVGAVESARNGAAFLGLITQTPGGVELTDLGREVVRFAIGHAGSVDAAVRQFETWQRSSERFVDIGGEWGTMARWVVYHYPATELLVTQLQRLHDNGKPDPTLPELVLAIFNEHPTFAVELFIRGTDHARSRVFLDENTLDATVLEDASIYASPTVFQLKAMLYHVGILTNRGAEPTRLTPNEDVWQLRHPI